jgi:hypothetical protein
MSIKKRIDILMHRLKGRTQSDGTPLPGYKQNVAAIRAELAQLQEQLGVNDGDR